MSVTDQRRFRDPHTHLSSLVGTVLVVCPACQQQAVVLPDPGDPPRSPTSAAAGDWARRRRLLCRHCGLVRVQEQAGRASFGVPVDPYFGRPLWLVTECCGQVLWAYDSDHLQLLEQYVAAELRERSGSAGQSVLTKLPAWMTSAKNRSDVLRGLARLRARVP